MCPHFVPSWALGTDLLPSVGELGLAASDPGFSPQVPGSGAILPFVAPAALDPLVTI